MRYLQIRREYQHHEYLDMVFVDPYAQLISPLLTKLCLRLGLIPNAVTVCMIIFGLIGAGLFAAPYLICRIAGVSMACRNAGQLMSSGDTARSPWR